MPLRFFETTAKRIRPSVKPISKTKKDGNVDLANNRVLPHLYEFLYRDPSRVTSLTAQINRGLLTGTERTTADRKMSESGLGLAAVVTGAYRSARDATATQKDSYQPHDQSLSDLLLELNAAKFVHPSPFFAPHGSIIQVTGSLEFADGAAIKMLATNLETIQEANATGPKVHKKSADRKIEKMGTKLIEDMDFPPIFMLFEANGSVTCGTLKSDGLDEPLSNFLFKYGGNQLPGIHVLGIKEVAHAPTPGAAESGLAVTSRIYSKVFESLVFPPEAMRVSPILIFRMIEPFPSVS